MTTPQDLFLVSLDIPREEPVEQGDLSLALAGAELIDLLGVRALSVADGRIVPGAGPATGDRLLDEAGAALVRTEPYETVEDWLWRRGQGLAVAYRDALEAAGQLTGRRRHRLALRDKDDPTADTPARRHAADRWWSHEPVLAGLASTLGIPDDRPAAPEPDDEAVVTVLLAVGDAVTELEAVRERRRIENIAFDNIWRAP
ncbi:GPP34 family phosphoprotein [Streptomyces sp. SID161]|uniref:GOLPH3/VPS74 family protein n=1 Tax=unclassified Streptomyces TaxID=2593676 RepID=UPI00136FAADE|nr:GPP34 family phosphoprotein [Streptomyces sp. SID161]MYW14028.1 GPP34 family phosphoprotein [Streptomyces sp. SID2955]MYW44611.1 GPP34 family phosphoprotein [Streptomyces sp. SID161]